MAIADVVLVAAWLAVVGHNACLWARGVRRETDTRRIVAGVVLAGVLVVAGVRLEHATGGPRATPVATTVVGVIVACCGAALHVHARRTLGRAWSSRVGGASVLVDDGAYGRVRHPLYAGLALLAIGTIAAHPSLPTIAGGVGLLVGIAAKIPREERALADRFGARWDSYRRDVPCVLPRLGRRHRAV